MFKSVLVIWPLFFQLPAPGFCEPFFINFILPAPSKKARFPAPALQHWFKFMCCVCVFNQNSALVTKLSLFTTEPLNICILIRFGLVNSINTSLRLNISAIFLYLRKILIVKLQCNVRLKVFQKKLLTFTHAVYSL